MIATFIGHRKISVVNNLYSKLKELILNLVDHKGVNIFLFGSASQFNDLCLKVVTELKTIRPTITRIYVRAEYTNITEEYKRYLLTMYDETFMPDNIVNAGKAAYVERNNYMIDLADICIFYYNENYSIPLKNSGTRLAFNYAIVKRKEIINLYVCN